MISCILCYVSPLVSTIGSVRVEGGSWGRGGGAQAVLLAFVQWPALSDFLVLDSHCTFM